MSAVRIHTAPNGLMALEAAASARTLDAYFYTFTKAQMVARTANPDPTSPAYFTGFVDTLATLGWHTTTAATISYAPDDPARTPLDGCAAAALEAVAQGAALPAACRGPVVTLIDALESALRAAPPKIATMLDGWWTLGTVHADSRTFAIGPILELFGTPIIPTIHLDLAVSATSWRSLAEPANFTFAVTPVLLRLEWSAYDAVAAALQSELAATLAQQIETAPLDLGAMR